MPDVRNLLDPRFEIMQWLPEIGKWADPGNDFFCSERPDGRWRVAARYGFEDGRDEIEFDGMHEAMQFFANYLLARRMRLAEGTRRAA